MKTLFLAASSGMALFAATPALAADIQDGKVQTVAVVMSEERRALAMAAVDAYWPQGQGEYMVNYITGDFADFVLNTPFSVMAEEYGLKQIIGSFAANMGELEAMMAEIEGVDADASGEEGEAPAKMPEPPSPEELDAMADMVIAMFGDQTVASMMAGQDEHFEERVSIIRDVLQTEMGPIYAKMEPTLRSSYAEMFAKRFTDAELTDIAAFAQTEGGRKYARDQWLFALDPTYFKAILTAVPESMTAMPELVKTMEERMAHLPPIGGEEADETDDAAEEVVTADDLIAQAEELEAEAEALIAEAKELRAQAAELE